MRDFFLYRRKSTDYKICYRDILDRIGNVYLPKPIVEKMCLGKEITVQLARNKSELKKGGYITTMIPHKETPKKMRFKENTWEQGALGVIYVSKTILEDMGLDSGEIAVRVARVAGKEEMTMENESLTRSSATST